MSTPGHYFPPIKVIDVELSRPIQTVEELENYAALKAVVRLHGVPLGYVQLPVAGGRCTAAALRQAIVEAHNWAIINHLLEDGLGGMLVEDDLSVTDLVDIPHPPYRGPYPLVTAVVCTRDRTADLAICLDALNRLDYPNLEILVVDNAPQEEATWQLVSTRYPHVRYVREPHPGLSWARNRAIVEAHGEIIAFTDDDVVVDPGWIQAVAQTFAADPEVMALTGLVVPYELETPAQILFEYHGGFGRGFEQQRYRVGRQGRSRAVIHQGAGKFGTGANMAFRRCLFERIGDFDTALGVGTVTQGGEDLEMFFRLLQEGFTLVYQPAALVRHRHRRDFTDLRRQLTNNAIALTSYHVRSALAYPDQRLIFLKLHLWWLWQWHIKRLLQSLTRPHRFPRELILAELKGYLIGLGRYRQARRSSMSDDSMPAARQQGNQRPMNLKELT